MFDLSLIEMGFILVVAFVIFGPERFPVMLREAFTWFRKIKDFAMQAQMSLSEIGRDVESQLPNLQNLASSAPSSAHAEGDPGAVVRPRRADRNVVHYSKEGMGIEALFVLARREEAYANEGLSRQEALEG